MCDIGILQDAGPGDDESRHYEADVSKVRNVAKTQKVSEGTIGNMKGFLHVRRIRTGLINLISCNAQGEGW